MELEDDFSDSVIEGFGLNGFGFEATGILGEGLIMQEANKNNFKAQIFDLNNQLDNIELSFIEQEAMRLNEVSQTIANIKAGASRRGLATGQETSVEGAVKRSESASNANKINYLNEQRSLIFRKEVAEATYKQEQKSDLFGILGNLGNAYIKNNSEG